MHDRLRARKVWEWLLADINLVFGWSIRQIFRLYDILFIYAFHFPWKVPNKLKVPAYLHIEILIWIFVVCVSSKIILLTSAFHSKN